jgi:hypothetical protein
VLARSDRGARRRLSWRRLGAAYDEGAPLFRIIRTDRLELRAQVPASDVSAARDITSLALEIPDVLIR